MKMDNNKQNKMLKTMDATGNFKDADKGGLPVIKSKMKKKGL